MGGFSDVSGVTFENEVETLKVGGVNDGDVQLAGPAKSTRLVLKRGLADRSYFWSWYLDVLQGEVPEGLFHNKYVLIGATAAGIADQYATPTSGKANLMPGVEVLANVTEGLLHDVHIRHANSFQNTALNLSFVGIALLGFSVLSPFFALLLTVSLVVGLFAASYFSVDLSGILFSPAIGIIGLLLIYPLWSWHRLSTATRYLTTEFESFQQRKNALFISKDNHRIKDFLDRK